MDCGYITPEGDCVDVYSPIGVPILEQPVTPVTELPNTGMEPNLILLAAVLIVFGIFAIIRDRLTR